MNGSYANRELLMTYGALETIQMGMGVGRALLMEWMFH